MTNLESCPIVLQTISKLTMRLLLYSFFIVLQCRAGLLQDLGSLMFFSFDAKLESFFFVWEVVVWLWREAFVVYCFICFP